MRRRVGLCVVVALAITVLPAPPALGQTVDGFVYRTPASGDPNGAMTIATMGLDGTNSAAASTAEHISAVVGSPDGRWVVADTGGVLKVMRPHGADPRMLADRGRSAAWAPTGERIAFVTGSATEPPAVHVVDVVSSEEDIALSPPRRIDLPDHGLGTPEFSPSGDWLVVQGHTSEGARIWLVAADGSAAEPVAEHSYVGRSLSWSPDGRLVTYAASAGDNPGEQVHVLDIATGRSRVLIPSTCRTDAAAFEPFGRYVAIARTCYRDGDLPEGVVDLVAPDGALLAILRPAGAYDLGEVLFAPDGRWVYVTWSGSPMSVAIDGSTQYRLEPTHPVSSSLSRLGPRRLEGAVPPPLPSGDTDTSDRPQPPPPEVLGHACPRNRVAPTWFTDLAQDDPRRLPADCVTWWRVLLRQGSRFRPASTMTREQFATVMVRILDAGGVSLPPARHDFFFDDDASVHERNINALAAAGLVRGNGDRFSPTSAIQRAQAASTAVALYEEVLGEPVPPATKDWYDDDTGSVHEDNINRAAEAGLIVGTSPRSFSPSARQRRDATAYTAAHLLDTFVERGRAKLPTYGEAFVTRVIDGDTVIADVNNDDGSVTRDVRIRMAGLNAPERRACGGRAAKDRLAWGLTRHTVKVSSRDPASVGREGRPIRFVHYYVGQWIDISEEMLRLGLALWMPHRAEPARQQFFNHTVQRAAARDVGIWNATFCARGPQQGAKIRVRVRPDAPGPDRHNLNGEVVVLRNVGTTRVDISGWHVRDSSLHPPYVFAPGTRIPPGKALRLHVGAGQETRLRKYWHARRPLFQNPSPSGSRGDGAYLYDPDGDIRAHHIYPCLVKRGCVG